MSAAMKPKYVYEMAARRGSISHHQTEQQQLHDENVEFLS